MNFYKISLSNKIEVDIDEADFEKLKMNIDSGKLIQLKQAVINPSFIVGITPLKKGLEEKIDGYIDEEKKVFVMTEKKIESPELADEFSKGANLLEEKLKA